MWWVSKDLHAGARSALPRRPLLAQSGHCQRKKLVQRFCNKANLLVCGGILMACKATISSAVLVCLRGGR
jgi:hypothetical protein